MNLALVLGSLVGLEDIGEGSLRAETATEAARFFHGLARVPSPPVHRGRLLRSCPVSSRPLVDLLIQVHDAFRCAVPAGRMDGDMLELQADACLRIASLINATMEASCPTDMGVIVQIDRDGVGNGEIVVVPISDEEREAAFKAQKAHRSRRIRREGR